MSFVWWVFGSLFIFFGLYFAFIAVDKHSARRKLRSGVVVQSGTLPDHQQPPTMVQANHSVIYTIPTTHQLAQQYPHMVQPQQQHQTGPMMVVPHPQHQPPPYLDLPPTYDQVLFNPASPNTPATTTSTGNTTLTLSTTTRASATTAAHQY